jgi:methionine-S-sulfoxide reductase
MEPTTRFDTTALSRPQQITTWTAQLLAAVILAQTLFFKFTGAPESVWIFSTLGVEPWGRWLAGTTELIAVVLLLIPRTAVYGAIVALGVMVGAIGAHLTRLGIEVQGDNGLLFGLALVVTAASLVVLVVRRHQLAAALARLRGGRAGAAAIAAAVVLGVGVSVAPHLDAQSSTESAYLAGGCFWGMEQLLREVEGVVDTEVGYLDAAGGGPGVAETVRLRFDPSVVSYEELLRFYFRIHDPTTRNRQGNDIGIGYRSAIFVVDEQQRRTAERVRAEIDASGFWKRPLVTEISDAGEFEVAEEGHQDYLAKNPGGYTCHFVRE